MNLYCWQSNQHFPQSLRLQRVWTEILTGAPFSPAGPGGPWGPLRPVRPMGPPGPAAPLSPGEPCHQRKKSSANAALCGN